MRVAFFSTHPFDREFFDEANTNGGHDLHYLEPRLTPATAVLAHGHPVVCAFVKDQLDASVLTELVAGGTRMVALRSAGFNHVDLATAQSLALTAHGSRLFAACGRGTHHRTDPRSRSPHPSRVRARA
jgi:D-lactate dehydrogenase